MIEITNLVRREKEGQSRFFHGVVQHPLSIYFPPAEDYTLRVLRLYYAAIDELCLEYDEDMMHLYTSLLERRRPPMPDGAGFIPPAPCHRTLLFDDGSSATCMVQPGFGGPTGTGARLWEAGIFMCEYIAANPEVFQVRAAGIPTTPRSRGHAPVDSDIAPAPSAEIKHRTPLGDKLLVPARAWGGA